MIKTSTSIVVSKTELSKVKDNALLIGFLKDEVSLSGDLKKFYDNKYYGFFDRIPNKGDLGALKHQNKQFLENCFAAIAFLRLYFLTKKESYRNAAENTLLHFADSCLNYGYFAAMYAIAVDMLLNQTKSLINTM